MTHKNLVMLFDDLSSASEFKNGGQYNSEVGFTLIQPSKFVNWASKSRYYADVIMADDLKPNEFKYICHKVTLGSVKDIWKHPTFNILHHYKAHPELLKLIPITMLTSDSWFEIISEDANFVRYLPPEVINRRIVGYVLEWDHELIRFIPQDRILNCDAEHVFACDIMMYDYIPQRLKTSSMDREYEEWRLTFK